MLHGVALSGTPASAKVLAAIGDSHTFNSSHLKRSEYYPDRLAKKLGLIPLNRGVSGNSSAQVFGRRSQLFAAGSPEIAVVYCGTNDINANGATVSASPPPTATRFSLTDDYVYHASGGWVSVGGQQAQVRSITGPEISLTSSLEAGAPAAGTPVLIDTQKNLEETIDYLTVAGIRNSAIFVVGQHYTNFSANGDTTLAEVGWARGLRDLQEAAAMSRGANYVDTFEYMRQLILTGAFSQGDAAWHVADLDTHLNALGEQVLADAISLRISSAA